MIFLRLVPYIYKFSLLLFGVISLSELSTMAEYINVFINDKNINLIFFYIVIVLVLILAIGWIGYNVLKKVKNNILQISLQTALWSLISFIVGNMRYISGILANTSPNSTGEIVKMFIFGNEIKINKLITLDQKILWFKELISSAQLEKYQQEIYNSINWDLISNKIELINVVTMALYKIQTDLILQIEQKAKTGIISKIGTFISEHPYLVGGVTLTIVCITYYFRSEIYNYLAENGAILRDFIHSQRAINRANLELLEQQELLGNQILELNKMLLKHIPDEEKLQYAAYAQQQFAFLLETMKNLSKITGNSQQKIAALEKAVNTINHTIYDMTDLT